MDRTRSKEDSTSTQQKTIEISTPWLAGNFDVLGHFQERFANEILKIENIAIPPERLMSPTGLMLSPTFMLTMRLSHQFPLVRR